MILLLSCTNVLKIVKPIHQLAEETKRIVIATSQRKNNGYQENMGEEPSVKEENARLQNELNQQTQYINNLDQEVMDKTDRINSLKHEIDE